jgi:type II secretory pathway pseudopilin PulG
MDTLHKQLTTPKTQGRDGSPSGPKPQATQSPSPFRIRHFAFPKASPSRLRAFAGNPTRHQPPATRHGRIAASAFTLIESVVAIGIFAFVIVGIVGLFGASLERQRQASFETRAVMISQQILARIRAAESATNVVFTRGTDADKALQPKIFHSANFTTSPTNTLVFYYKKDGTEISGLLATNDYTNNTYTFFPGYPPETLTDDIVGRAQLTATTNNTGNPSLYRVTIEVSEPANLPLAARRYTNTFTTFATFPN